ncbi:hypothetical protein FOS14_19555 [Skermania sp. ID1734]|uniref:hypothetical protein n=1 Tax=Skermania sp. ID1734 TaxID=2597516 RepID=UPI0011810CA2|nr:hypothetical protein [Skermania sp. ID1734]TSD94840.1 hypothetical protein FOS14_19555 [Skermania sp. ID1734]
MSAGQIEVGDVVTTRVSAGVWQVVHVAHGQVWLQHVDDERRLTVPIGTVKLRHKATLSARHVEPAGDDESPSLFTLDGDS